MHAYSVCRVFRLFHIIIKWFFSGPRARRSHGSIAGRFQGPFEYVWASARFQWDVSNATPIKADGTVGIDDADRRVRRLTFNSTVGIDDATRQRTVNSTVRIDDAARRLTVDGTVGIDDADRRIRRRTLSRTSTITIKNHLIGYGRS